MRPPGLRPRVPAPFWLVAWPWRLSHFQSICHFPAQPGDMLFPTSWAQQRQKLAPCFISWSSVEFILEMPVSFPCEKGKYKKLNTGNTSSIEAAKFLGTCFGSPASLQNQHLWPSAPPPRPAWRSGTTFRVLFLVFSFLAVCLVLFYWSDLVTLVPESHQLRHLFQEWNISIINWWGWHRQWMLWCSAQIDQ